MNGDEDDRTNQETVDPFQEGRRPFWITVIGLSVLVLIAWANGWIVPSWER